MKELNNPNFDMNNELDRKYLTERAEMRAERDRVFELEQKARKEQIEYEARREHKEKIQEEQEHINYLNEVDDYEEEEKFLNENVR